MHFKKKIQKKVYYLYLNGVDVTNIASFLDLSENDTNEIIDYLNQIYC